MRIIVVAALLTVLVGAAGCAEGDEPAARPGPTVTETVTATVTAAPSEAASPAATSSIGPWDEAAPAPPRLTLTVFEDGCGVIRSESTPGGHHNLTWSFRDTDGFQVLGRNAEGETRYRFFRPGTFDVVLEAWHVSRYVPVSNVVRVHC